MTASSFGNELRVFVTFRKLLLSDSMAKARVDHFADLLGMCEERDRSCPVRSPAFRDHRKFVVPFFGKFREPRFGLRFGRRRVNTSQTGGHFLALFPADEVQRVPHHMHDAQLDLRPRIYSLDRLETLGFEAFLKRQPTQKLSHLRLQRKPPQHYVSFADIYVKDLFFTINICLSITSSDP